MGSSQLHVVGGNNQNAGTQAVLDLGIGDDDARAGLIDDPASVTQVFSQQVANRQFAEVLHLIWQVQSEGVTVLDHFARNGKQREPVQ